MVLFETAFLITYSQLQFEKIVYNFDVITSCAWGHSDGQWWDLSIDIRATSSVELTLYRELNKYRSLKVTL